MPRLAATPDVTLVTNTKLTDLLSTYLDLQATVKKLQDEMKEINDDMKRLAFKAHTKGQALETDTHIVRYVEARSADAIDKTKMLKFLTAKQIAACTKPGTDYAYVGIYPKKDDADVPRPSRRLKR